jgi:predicted nucleic acid-binding protein
VSGPTLILDSAAFSSISRQEPSGQVILMAALANDQRVVVPTVVLAEVMTGKANDAAHWHTLGRLVVCDATARIAARAGALREHAESVRRKKRDLTVDAIVASTAMEYAPAVILTADVGDMSLLLSSPEIRVVQV